MARPQEAPREKREGMAPLGPREHAAGPLCRGDMGASFRFMEGHANGLPVFLEANVGGGFERGEGNLQSTKTDPCGPIVLERDAGGRGSTPDQRQTKKSGRSPPACGKVSKRSTEHSTWPHRTPCVHVYAPANQKSNRETARLSGPIIMRCAHAAFLLDAGGSVR
jgi:hypothetical protein